MVRRVRKVNVILDVSLRPRWCKFIPAGLYDAEVSEAMETQAESALKQFPHADYVTVSARYDDGSKDRRTIVRSRADFGHTVTAPLPEPGDLLAENRELRARVLLLEMALEEHGVIVPHRGQSTAPHSPQP